MHDPKEAFEYLDGRLVLARPEKLSEAHWRAIAGAFRKLGYRNSSPLQAMRQLSGLALDNRSEGRLGYKLQPDQQTEVECLFYGRRKPDETALARRLERKAIELYGTTDDLSLAGYITPCGYILNFSRQGRQRDIDHREVLELFEDEAEEPENEPGGNSAAMLKLLSLGFIRLIGGGMSMIVPPTIAQEHPVAAFCRYSKYEDFYLEFATPAGAVAASKSFRPMTPYPAIRNQIRSFADTGYFLGEYDEDVCRQGFALAAAG